KNKEKFFHQYWGQRIHKTEAKEHIYMVDGRYDDIKTDYLLLTPLSQITDEDLNFISIVIGYENTKEGLALIKRWLTPLYKKDYSFFAIIDCKNVIITTKIIDYLRSKGYALPW